MDEAPANTIYGSVNGCSLLPHKHKANACAPRNKPTFIFSWTKLGTSCDLLQILKSSTNVCHKINCPKINIDQSIYHFTPYDIFPQIFPSHKHQQFLTSVFPSVSFFILSSTSLPVILLKEKLN